MATVTDLTNVPSGVSPVVYEAQQRWRKCEKWESTARQRFLDDFKFANADVYNGYQWPNEIKRNRDIDERPSLTINKTRQHNRQIINDAQQNRPGVKFRATGAGASYRSAQMYDALAKHIEYQSNADDHYDLAVSHMVQGGWGWLRLGTEFIKGTFDQEIRIYGVPDPLTVYIDPDARELDKSDAKFAFLFEDKDRDEFVKSHPNWAKYAGQNALGDSDGWMTTDKIRIAEYFRLKEVKDTLLALRGPDGKLKVFRKSQLSKQAVAALKQEEEAASREVTELKLEYFFIVGDKIVEERSVDSGNPMPGDTIPIVPVIAEEIIIEGTMDRKSHTRALIDPQRMYNYWSSAAVEYGALQGKTPWIAPAEAIEEYEQYWNTANTTNHSVLPYNAFVEGSDKIVPMPQRIEPPVAAPVCITGMQVAQTEMMLVSGQYQSTMGEASNERSGKAINERQRQGENSTYHYINALGIAIKRVGKIILKWAPEVYDTERMMLCMAEDGSQIEMKLDPKAAQAYQKQQAEAAETAMHIFNPGVGTYEVEADIGPAYGTRRQEAWNALTLILTQAPQLTSIIGDLLLKSGDFPLSEEAAMRMRRMVPPQALGEGPSLAEQALTQQNQQLTGLLQKAMEEMGQLNLKIKGKDQARDIDVFNAYTQRMKTLLDAAIKAGQQVDEKTLDSTMDQVVSEMLSTTLQPVIEANEPGLENAAALGKLQNLHGGPLKPPFPGARLAPNGEWYMKDWSQQKGYMPVS